MRAVLLTRTVLEAGSALSGATANHAHERLQLEKMCVIVGRVRAPARLEVAGAVLTSEARRLDDIVL
jgi:hypothetical protein